MRSILALSLLFTSLSVKAFSLGAYNIRNFDYDERYRIRTNKPALSAILKSLNVDVLSIEEINNTARWDEFVQKDLPGYDTELSRCGGAHGQRLGFLYKKATVDLLSFHEDLSIVNPGTPGSCDSGSRPVAIGLFQIKATGQRFYGLTVHLKSGSAPQSIAKRLKQYQVLKNIIHELRKKTGVKEFYIAGDLNTTEWMNRGQDFVQLSKVTKELGMLNLTQNIPCSSYWWGGTDDQIETPSKLDHVLATPGLIKVRGQSYLFGHCQKVSCRQVPVRDLGVSYEGVSDHCPITAHIQ